MPQGNAAARPKHPRTGYFVTRRLFDELDGFADLEARIAELPVGDRGDAFEVFAEAYLATQKLVGAEEVWPADQVPIAVLQSCGLPFQDMGADGVYKTCAGQYNAYQSKFRTGRPSLTWQELSTFMGLTDQVGERVLFTNCDDLSPVMDDRSGFFCIRGNDLERLTKDDLQAIADWLRGAAFTPKRKEPLPHQSEALQAILSGLDEHDRVTAVMACATGKTLVALWLAERMKANRILVLVPSLALVRQTLHEWLKETAWEQPQFIAVCSDPTVVQGVEDALVVHQRDLDFPVTTDVSEVRDFLVAHEEGVKIVFSTYQSAHVVGDACRGRNTFDLAIFDEAHKTAGREGADFGFALEDRNLQIAKRVFLTATPRHYDVRKTNKEDKALVYSMDQPVIYGPIAHTLSFAKAAKEGIICNYKIIISIVTSDMINADLLSRGEVIVEGEVIRARTVANQIAIQKACEKHDLKKIFSFHRSVASAKDFTGNTARSIRSHLPDYETYHVNGEMQTTDREKAIRAFREADRAIMSNARCLTEGVEVPAVDVVAFLSPRKSKVDIVQAAGRAMRKPEGKEMGYVLLPLFLETQENETIEEALERTDFEEAWDVLQAMQEQDAVLAEIIREMREERGRCGGFDDSRLREKVEVLGPKVSLEVLRGAVSTAMVDRLGVTWDERHGELRHYKDRFGHCNVPKTWSENPKLATWVATQRWLARQGRLSSELRARLDGLGFDWDPFDALWETTFTKLKRYKERFSTCNVPSTSRLGVWVRGQRVLLRQGRLSSERKARLDDLGFDWDPLDALWETTFTKLKRYKDRFGDCNVSQAWAEDPQLAEWVAWQRQRWKQGTLTEDRKTRLDALGFVWNARDFAWEKMFAELERYKLRFGRCNVPRKWSENLGLANWVNDQRAAEMRGQLAPERKERLDKLGFVWNFRDSAWGKMFAELKRYKQRFGDCSVPEKESPQLASWVFAQRQQWKQDSLTKDQKTRLDALGFDWDPQGSAWEIMFTKVKRYKQRFGDCNVPPKEDPQLTLWAAKQRYHRKQGTLTEDRKTRLDALGFDWDPKDSTWETMFTKLKCYKERFGDCNVPQAWAEDPQLGSWVAVQRRFRKEGTLFSERKARLDSLGFAWVVRQNTRRPAAE